MIDKFGLVDHAFDDDIQLIVSSSPEFFHCAINRFVECLSEIDAWMSSNRLKLNQDKTQLRPIGTWQQLSKIDNRSVVIGNSTVEFCDKASNLGFTLDSNLTMNQQIRSL